MAKIKICEKCEKKISIREMPNGKWLPFEYQSDKLHKCNKAIVTSPANKNNSENFNKNNQDFVGNPIKYSKINEAINTQKNLTFDYTKKTSAGKNEISMIPIKVDGTSKVIGFCFPVNEQYTFDIIGMKNIKIIERLKSIEEIEFDKKKQIDEKSYSIYDDSKKLYFTFILEGFNGIPIDNKLFINHIKNILKDWIFELFNTTPELSRAKYNQFKVMYHLTMRKEQLINMITYDEALTMYQNQMTIKLIEEAEINKKKEVDKKNEEQKNINEKNSGYIIKLAFVIVVIFWLVSMNR